MQGKYSPTVSAAYSNSQDWFYKNCNKDYFNYDKDGYDLYGYDHNNLDRAGNHEDDYINNNDLFQSILSNWTVDSITGAPKRR